MNAVFTGNDRIILNSCERLSVDALAFISELVESLAWPSVVLVLGLVFRSEFFQLISVMKKLKAGPVEAEFEVAARGARVRAEKISFINDNEEICEHKSKYGRDRIDMIDSLIGARNDPTGVILRGWAEIDAELFRLGVQIGDIADPLTGTEKVYNLVMGSNVLPYNTMKLISELRDLRNKVAHAQVVPTPDAAQDYILAVDRVVQMIFNYRKNLSNFRPNAG